jgi:hypothetical protein
MVGWWGDGTWGDGVMGGVGGVMQYWLTTTCSLPAAHPAAHQPLHLHPRVAQANAGKRGGVEVDSTHATAAAFGVQPTRTAHRPTHPPTHQVNQPINPPTDDPSTTSRQPPTAGQRCGKAGEAKNTYGTRPCIQAARATHRPPTHQPAPNHQP